MSIIHKGLNKLEEKVKKNLKLAVMFFIPLMLYFVAFSMGFHLPGIFHLLPMVIFGWPAAMFFSRYSSYKSGLTGENKALIDLEQLPNDYHLFNNLLITDGDRKRELDLVIVGPTGLFVVEVKNHNGKIKGAVEDKQWIQHKVGRRGTPYSSKMYNPLKQLGGQIFSLSQLMKNMDVNVWIEGIVYFTNKDVRLDISGENSKVIGDKHLLQQYILNYPYRKKLNNDDIGIIVSKLLEMCS